MSYIKKGRTAPVMTRFFGVRFPEDLASFVESRDTSASEYLRSLVMADRERAMKSEQGERDHDRT